MKFAVEFDGRIGLAIQDNVNLGVMQVVMRSSILGDFRQVDCAGELILLFKGSASNPAGAGQGWQRWQIDQGGFAIGVIRARWDGNHLCEMMWEGL